MSDKDGKMDEKDTFQTVGEVADLVNDAIRTGDYSSLNRKISKVLSDAADSVHDSLAGAVLGDKPFFRTEEGRSYKAQSSGSYQDAKDRARQPQSDLSGKQNRSSGSGVVSAFGAHASSWVCGLFTFIFGIASGSSLALDGMNGMAVFCGVLAALSGWGLYKGARKVNMVRRARKLLKLMDGRDTITVREVAAAFGKDEEWTAKELQSMIRDGIFTGRAYMDKEGTAFMTSRGAYSQYEETMQAYQERMKASAGTGSVFRESDLKEYRKMEQNAQERDAKAAKEAVNLDLEKRAVVEEGRAFIAHIHQKNEEIPGEDFSDKLDRLEKVVTGIFDKVEEDPKSAPDLHRLMKYYLPTTQKLVDTYAALDRQKVQGQNIENAKREIEDSLDTINDAFEKILDSFYQSTAWDVSSDISVMGQMMAQDGLTGGNEFSSGTPSYTQTSWGGAAAAMPAPDASAAEEKN